MTICSGYLSLSWHSGQTSLLFEPPCHPLHSLHLYVDFSTLSSCTIGWLRVPW